MKIKYFEEIALSRPTNDTHFNMNQQISSCLGEESNVEVKYPEPVASYLAAFEKEDEAMKQTRKSILTPDVNEQGSRRIFEYRRLRDGVKYGLSSLNRDERLAAEFLWSVIKKHGDIPTLKVGACTGALTNLCQDFNQKYRNLTEKLHLTETSERLQAANDEYIRLYDIRLHEWSNYVNREIEEARKQVDSTLEDLLLCVAVGIILEGYAPFEHFVKFVNEVFKRTKIAMGSSTTIKPENPNETKPGDELKRYRYADFMNGEELFGRVRCEVGKAIPKSKIPTPPEGMKWEGIPKKMPDEDIVITAVPVEAEGGEETNTPQDFTPEQLRNFPIYPSQYGAVTEITNPNSLISPFNPLSINYKFSNLLPGTPAPTEGEVPEGKAKVKFDREAEEEEARAIKRFLHRELRKENGEKVENLDNLENIDSLENLEETDSALLDTKNFCLWYDLGSSVRTQGFVPECLTGFHWDIQQMDYVLDTAHHTIRLVKDEDEHEDEDQGGEQTLTPGMDWPADVPAPEGWTKVVFRDKDGRETVKLYRNGSSVYTQGGYPENAPGYEWIGIHAILNGNTHTITEAEE